MKNPLKKVKIESNKLAAITAIWLVVIIAASILLRENGIFIQLLPVLCIGGFLSVAVEIYTSKME